MIIIFHNNNNIRFSNLFFTFYMLFGYLDTITIQTTLSLSLSPDSTKKMTTLHKRSHSNAFPEDEHDNDHVSKKISSGSDSELKDLVNKVCIKQEFSDQQADKLHNLAQNIASGESNAFIGIFGQACTGKSSFCMQMALACSSKFDCNIEASGIDNDWIKKLFQQVADAQNLDLSQSVDFFYIHEIRKHMDITSSQVEAMSKHLPITITWKGRIPKNVVSRVRKLPGVVCKINSYRKPNVTTLTATIKLPRVVILYGCECAQFKVDTDGVFPFEKRYN